MDDRFSVATRLDSLDESSDSESLFPSDYGVRERIPKEGSL